MLGLLIVAQDRGEQDPGGFGLPLIIGILVLLAVGGFLLHYLLHRGARKSKGGVEPPIGEKDQRHPSAPPLESIEPRS